MEHAMRIAIDSSPQEVFEMIRAQGKDAILLEGSPWSFICQVNKDVKVPPGEAGLHFVRDFVRRNRTERRHDDPPFIGGFVGFIGYGVGLDWMGIPRAQKSSTPDTHFVFVKKVVAVPQGRPRESISRNRQSPHSCGAALPRLSAPPPSLRSGPSWRRLRDVPRNGHHGSGPAEYFKKVSEIHQLLAAGETYQVNFSRRFEVPFTASAWEFYKNLSARNPSQFQVFIETDDWAIVSNSPERLFSLRDGVIRTEPIKGTVPRGANQKEDKARIAELLASEKDDAELSMIVDLSRNDIGKIAVPGSLTVRKHRAIRKLSHVLHTYSMVEARADPRFDWFDCLKALFPGGSITGCPKKRTMEIIQKLEGFSRGVYCGSAGYISLDGNCDFNIMIRTAWVDKKKQLLTFHSGGGIVADSDAKKEFEETEYKARAMRETIEESREHT